MIPTRLLIHNCTIYRTVEMSRDRTPTKVDTIELERVRVASVVGYVDNDLGHTKADRVTLFYDPLVSSSKPAGYEPKEGDRVEWRGNTFTIQNVNILFTQGGEEVHHYEAALV